MWSKSEEKAMKLPRVNVCLATHAKWSNVHHQGCTVFAWSVTSGIISHIMKALVPLPCFIFSHTPQIFPPNNKLSHPFFITKVFQCWTSLKVKDFFLVISRLQFLKSARFARKTWKGKLYEYVTTSTACHVTTWLWCSCSGHFLTLFN